MSGVAARASMSSRAGMLVSAPSASTEHAAAAAAYRIASSTVAPSPYRLATKEPR